ncbi:MAG: holdfast anchor protein HfaD, partial [Brevundimonas sp.]|nr:holdfast anchor protein HfaD [Brevundimonas sp.]
MAKPARIRLAGTIAATALCAAAATEVAAQTPPDDSIVLNQQLQLGDVFSHQTLNVVDAQEQVTVSTSAQGNSASGAVENGSITLQSDQDMRGDAVATTDMTFGGDTYGVVNATIQAQGNYLAVSAYDSDLTVDATQSNTGGLVSATSQLGDDDARLLGSAYINASAISNTVAMYGEGSAVGGSIDQSSSATVRAYNRIETQYIPAEAVVDSQAIVNAVQVTSDQTSGQNLALVQTSTGDFVEAESSANAGNAWDL